MTIDSDPIRFSIVNELKSRWAPNHLATAKMKPNAWRRVLLELRSWWGNGEETILETRFYEPLKKSN